MGKGYRQDYILQVHVLLRLSPSMFNLISKKRTGAKNCSFLWALTTLPTKTDVKSYHTSRIKGVVVSGEGQEIQKEHLTAALYHKYHCAVYDFIESESQRDGNHGKMKGERCL